MPKNISWQKHSGEILDTVKGFEVIECSTCGFRHIVPIPSNEELESVYRQEYYDTEKPQNFKNFEKDLEWWNQVYAERYDYFEHTLGKNRRRILDIGSGPGYFLLHGKQRGWECVGVEPAVQSVEYSRDLGLEIHDVFFDETTAQTLGGFDVVHLGHVLEHIPSPRSFLRLVQRSLSPRGLICIVVPNDYNPFQKVLARACGFNPWWVSPPHHINYFNFDSASRLLEEEGFTLLRRDASFPIEFFLLMGENYIGNPELGRFCHGKRKKFELNLIRGSQGELKNRLYEKFADLGIGREVILIGRRD